MDVGLGEQDRAAEGRDGGDALGDPGDDGRRESLERLVQEEQGGVERQRPRDRQHLALAAGQPHPPRPA